MKKAEALQKMFRKVILAPVRTYETVETIAVQVMTGKETKAMEVLREAQIPTVGEVFLPKFELHVYNAEGETVERELCKSYILVRCILDAWTWHAITDVLRERGLLIKILDAAPVYAEEEERFQEPFAAVKEETVEQVAAAEPNYLVEIFRQVLAEKAAMIVRKAKKYFILPFEVWEQEWWEQRIPLPLRL